MDATVAWVVKAGPETGQTGEAAVSVTPAEENTTQYNSRLFFLLDTLNETHLCIMWFRSYNSALVELSLQSRSCAYTLFPSMMCWVLLGLCGLLAAPPMVGVS